MRTGPTKAKHVKQAQELASKKDNKCANPTAQGFDALLPAAHLPKKFVTAKTTTVTVESMMASYKLAALPVAMEPKPVKQGNGPTVPLHSRKPRPATTWMTTATDRSTTA